MEKIIDLFCGAGGESAGIKAAAKTMGIKTKMAVVNHWERAIETHKFNFPEAVHYCEDVETLNPLEVFKARDRVALLWASIECTHHSNARGGRPCSDQSRAQAWQILKWTSELYIRRVIIENVPEFMNWGPLGQDGRPLKAQKGKTFEAFIHALKAQGYTVDHRILCAADYGDPTTRRRFFLQAVRGKGKIMWPTPSHAENPGLFKEKGWVPARKIIDWKLKGESIISRKKQLAPATLARIEAGIKKYWGQWAEPFLVVLRGTGTVRGLDQPAPALTAGGTHLGLVEPFLVRYNGDRKGNSDSKKRNYSLKNPIGTLDCSNRYGIVEPFVMAIDNRGHKRSHKSDTNSLGEPLRTITTKNRFGIVEPFLFTSTHGGRSRKIDRPMPTVTGANRGEHGVVEPFVIQYYGNGQASPVRIPLATVTTKDRFALIEGKHVGLDITFRMLQPHELAAAQGFPKSYVFTGNKGEQVKQIGNAVPVNTAKALAMSALGAA